MSKNFQKIKVFILTLIWVGFLGVQERGVVEVKLPPI